MSLTYIGPVGTPVFDATPSPLAIPYPTVSAGDILIAIVAVKPDTSTITTPGGWTDPTNGEKTGGTGAVGVDTGPLKIKVFYKVATGSESGTLDVTVGNSPSVAGGFIYQCRATSGVYSIAVANGSDDSAGSSWSVTAGQTIQMASGDKLLTACAIPTDATSGAWTSESQTLTGCTLSFDLSNTPYNETTLGNDMAVRGAPQSCTAGSGTAAPTHTATVPATATNVAGPELFIRVREVTATVVEGSAALAADSSLTATGIPVKLGAAALVSESSLIVTAKDTVFAASALSSQSSLVSTSKVQTFAVSALSSESLLIAAGAVRKEASAALTSESSLVAIGNVKVPGSAPLSSETSLTLAATVHSFAQSALVAESSAITVGRRGPSALSALSAQSSLISTSVVKVLSQANLAADSSLIVAARVKVFAVAPLDGQSSLTCAATLGGARAALSTESTLTAQAVVSSFGTSALSGQSSLIALGTVSVIGLAQLSSQTSLTVLADVRVISTSQLQGESSLLAIGRVTGDVFFSASLSAISKMFVLRPVRRRFAKLSGDNPPGGLTGVSRVRTN